MKMPTSCLFCQFGYCIQGKVWCNQLQRNSETLSVRDPECPLVEVETPHGRLIDVDYLEPDAEWDSYYDGFLSYSKHALEAAETVIGEESDERL